MSHPIKNKPSLNKKKSQKNKFEQFFKKGIFFRSDFFDVWFMPVLESKKVNTYVVVRKKVCKKATERNLWRRRIKEIVRKENCGSLSLLFKIKEGFDKPASSKDLFCVWREVYKQYKKVE